jgi:hypothetical protein
MTEMPIAVFLPVDPLRREKARTVPSVETVKDLIVISRGSTSGGCRDFPFFFIVTKSVIAARVKIYTWKLKRSGFFAVGILEENVVRQRGDTCERR